ncbi:response regulator [Nitrosomonas sp. JL21]|uniref:response regulator n=1 Tax=Nitrosomonas sp. JL21 TaxID=153949 RepID=UPI00136D19F5|nr:response regulator [Nitrosomonas sp. JL21]MBL8496517.1 response regulator [Nitrosomonas sp.]MCC7092311.1 response regulator [Nitrosomonas sp.]MXS76895.1 response regulator [Nitrosomonas sp. JL21]
MEGLIVEPSRTYQKLLSSAIESGGLKTKQVSSGSEALALLETNSFDLVFVAMHLQDMDAPRFSSHIRSNSQTQQVPIIMVTSNDDKKLLDEAFSAGISEIFAKHELDKITNFAAQFSRKKSSGAMAGRILYIEESPSAANLTLSVLTENGFTVDHCSTGEQGLEAFEKNAYDLVLTDVMLKGKLNGYGTLKAIRQLDENQQQSVPLLVFSVLDDVAHKVELLRLGAADYVTKPLIEEELLARIHTLILNKQLREKSATQQHLLQELALKDPLTGLYNRYFLLEAAASKMREATRHSIPCSLILINPDKFQWINKQHGHTKGDAILKKIASLLTQSIRREDITARYDGEEFAVLLSHCNVYNATIIAEKLRKSIENLCPAGVDITASFGVAEIMPDSSGNFSELLDAARNGVVLAQTSGGNQVITHQ